MLGEIPFVNMAEQSAWEEYYAGLAAGETVHEPDPPKRDFFHHQVLAADFDQAGHGRHIRWVRVPVTRRAGWGVIMIRGLLREIYFYSGR